MVFPQGGFFFTQDADSEGEEGKFFTWTLAEIAAALPPEDTELFIKYYGVTQEGNFEGKNILHVAQDAQTAAADAEISLEELQASLALSREILFAVREKRVKPGRDEKILTSWNGLMLRSFAEAGRYLSRPDYLQVAINNVDVLLRLAAFTGEEVYRQFADDYLRPIADIMVQHPKAFGHALGALDFAISQSKEIAIIGDPRQADTRALLEVVNERYLPDSVLACASPADIEAVQSIPLLADRPMQDGKATAYVCQNFACLAPVNTPEELEKLL